MNIPEQLEGFDVVDAVDRMLGQPQLWWQAVRLFANHFADWEERWLKAQDDPLGERRLVHALRSAAGNIGAVQLTAQAAALERALLAGVPLETAQRERLGTCFRQVCAVIVSAQAGERG